MVEQPLHPPPVDTEEELPLLQLRVDLLEAMEVVPLLVDTEDNRYEKKKISNFRNILA